MYVYKLQDVPNYELGTYTVDEMSSRISAVNILKLKSYSPVAFKQDIDEFKRLAACVGWKGHIAGALRCSTGLSPILTSVTFFCRDGMTGEVYVGAPHRLHHLEEHAIEQMDSQQVERTKAIMQGTEWSDGQAPLHGGWRISAKGNHWASIEGVSCVVLPVHGANGRYKGMLRGGGNNVIYTKEFASVTGTIQYIENNFYTLTEAWLEHKTRETPDYGYYLDDDQ